MRVIGGELRRRTLAAPPGHTTRPSSDRLRETLFNILGESVRGHAFLDLYAGTGAVGIEAWSRGAGSVAWVESDATAMRVLRANLKALGVPATLVFESPFPRAFAKLGGGWDFIFLDPPYEDSRAYSGFWTALTRHPELASAIATVIIETRRGTELGAPSLGWRLARQHRVGDTCLNFFGRSL